MGGDLEAQGAGPLRLVEFTKAFFIGGTEGQVVELLRGLPKSYQVSVAVLDELGPLLEKVWQLGHVPKAFSLRGTVVSPNTGLQIVRMAAWLRSNRIELVHVHDFYSTLVAVPACKLAGSKVIVSRLDLLHWHGKVRSKVIAELTRMADHVIANADAVKQFCVDREGIAPEKISVIRNGIDLKRFDERRHGELEAPLPDVGDAPVAVHVANMSHSVKRQEDFLHAMKRAKEKVGPLHAWLVGDGCRRPQLEALARELGLEDCAHFLGLRSDAPAIQARATFGVLSSNKEGLSNAVIEGMAAGLPMIVTDVGGNPELIDEGRRGYVVPAEQPAAMAEAIVKLLSNREKARKMGAAGRAFVERELSLEKMIAQHDALYRRVARAHVEESMSPHPAMA